MKRFHCASLALGFVAGILVMVLSACAPERAAFKAGACLCNGYKSKCDCAKCGCCGVRPCGTLLNDDREVYCNVKSQVNGPHHREACPCDGGCKCQK